MKRCSSWQDMIEYGKHVLSMIGIFNSVLDEVPFGEILGEILMKSGSGRSKKVLTELDPSGTLPQPLLLKK